MDSYFVFREARSTSELEALFRLRYKVYQNSRLHCFEPANEYGINLDCYDLRARHFGLYMNDEVLVANHCAVGETLSPMINELLEIAG